MSKIRSVLMMLRGHMADWLHSPRTLISGLVVLALTYMNARNYVFLLESNELYSHFGEAVFYYLSSGFGNISLVSALFLVMMSEVPRRTAHQNMMLIRTNRIRWLLSQVLFCLMVTILMMGLMLTLSMTMTWPHLVYGGGWSDLERIAVNPDAEWMVQLAPKYVRSITPFAAASIAAAILFAFWFTMVLVILFFTLAGHPNLGLILYVSLLVLNVTVLWEQLPSWAQNMPVTFATMSSIANKFTDRELSSIPTVLLSYLGADIILIFWMYLKTCRMDMFFTGKDIT